MKPYTVVGKYDDDTDQPFVFHVEAPSVEEAKAMCMSLLDNDNATICEVFAGHITGATDDDVATQRLIGRVAVDSGQLLITDPSYIDSEWRDQPFLDIRRYQAADGRVLEYRKDFSNFEDIPEGFGGKTVNQLVADGELVKVRPNKQPNRYSYAGCCQATTEAEHFGELVFTRGHAGAGVVFSSGYGDGYYPVYGKFDEHGRIVTVLIDMQ